jgi:hypothetical protein
MQLSTITTKTESLYFACSPQWGLVSYGGCQDEALNNLTDEVRQYEQAAGEGSHAR